MYQSNYIDDPGKKTLKHSNSTISDSHSRFTGADKLRISGMKTSNYNEMPLSQYYDNILNTRAKDRDRSRDRNPMFRSQSMSRGGSLSDRGETNTKDLSNYTLPADVIKFLDEEPGRVADLEYQIKLEKDKVDEILDGLLEQINLVIEEKRRSIKVTFDSFIQSYSSARKLFQNKLDEFKDTTKMIGISKIGGSADRLVNLDSIEFHDHSGKIKEETCNLKCRLGSLSKEIEKKYLSFFGQHLEKELCHRPSLSLTETSKEYLVDMTRIIKEKVISNLEILDGLVYKVDPFQFDKLTVKPVVKPSVGESKSNIIANIGNPMQDDYRFKVEYVETDFSEKINCICVIEEDLVATGHSDKTVGLWSMGKNTRIASLREHTAAVSSLVSIKAYFPEINLAKDAKVESGYIKNKNIKQQNFLVSGSEGPQSELLLWDLQAMTLLRRLSGHIDTVTSLIALRDGHSVISGSLDGSLKCWDIAKEEPIQSIEEEVVNPIYYIHVFNDFTHFMTGTKSGELHVFKVLYGFSKRYERTVFESCKKVRTIKTSSPVFVINESMTRDNTVVSGGADKRLTFWNTVTSTEQKKIADHQTDIIGCVMVENPINTRSNSYVLSFGSYEDRIQITDTSTGDSKQMALDTDISLSGGRYSNPNFQFMTTTDVFGKSKIHLLCSGTKHGVPCLVKIRIDADDALT